MYEKFFCKILKDILISLVITYFLLLVPELVLPGIVSSHFSPKYLLAAIVLVGLAFSRLGQKFKAAEKTKFRAISRNLLNIILFIIAIMLVLSLYKMKLWQIAVTVIIALALLVGAEKILAEEETES